MTHHAGAPGPLSTLLDACTAAIAAADDITDPIERARALDDAAEIVPEVQRRIRRARAGAIRAALDAQRTGDQVAAELGISRSRLYKILAD